MTKFTRKGKKNAQNISTASLPDIIFMLLFFFMVVTVTRENEPLLDIEKPSASETQKLKKRSLVDYIYVGPPSEAKNGSTPLMQLDDSFAELEDIGAWIDGNVKRRHENDKAKITTSLKVDSKTQMGLVSQIKQELRKTDALKISYSVDSNLDINRWFWKRMEA